MKDFITQHWNNKELPAGIRVLTAVTALRWVGWGFAESLIPVLLYTFGHNFATAGLLNSAYTVSLIIALPLIGIAADRMRATTLIIIGLCLYVLVGSSYFLAGATGLVLFIIAARLINGIAYSFDVVGRQTYFMRNTPPELVATAFGYLDTIADFWWIVAGFAGIVLIKFFSIPTLLSLIVPTALICIMLLVRFRKKHGENDPVPTKKEVEKSTQRKEVRTWNKTLRSLMLFNFFINAIGAVVAFFVPIEAYKNGASLPAVILMGIITTVPTLFGWDLGKTFDKKGTRTFMLALIWFAVLLFGLAFLRSYAWEVIIYFIVNIVLELLYVGSLELITKHTNPEQIGKVDGTMSSIEYIGSLVGPLAAGVIMDSFGVSTAYISLAVIILLITGMFYILQKKGYLEKAAVAVMVEGPLLEK